MPEKSKQDIKRFLIVDDDEDSQAAFKGLLSQLQIQDITIEKSAVEALGQLDPKRIEFLIVNWDLKGEMKAPIFLQRVRGAAAFRNIPFVIYSREFGKDDLALLNDYGIKNICPAPVDEDLAINVLKQAIAKENELDQASRRLRQASGYLADKDPLEAMNIIKETMSNEDTKSQAYGLKGEVHLFKDEVEEAEESLDKALEIDKRNSDAMQSMAKVYSRSGRHDEAIQILNKMVEVSPKNLSNMICLGAAYVDADEHEKAKAELKKVTDADPDNPQAKDQLGKIAFKEKNFSLAEQILENTLNKDELGRTFNNVGVGQVSRGEFDDGIKSYDVAMRILGDNRYTHMLKYNKGLALKKKGDLTQAFDMFYEACKSNPSYEKAYSSLIRLARTMAKDKVKFDRNRIQELKALRAKAEKPGAA